MQGHLHSAFANIRPPGHHSGPSRMDGFCFLNNVAIAAQYALDTLQAKKVLILDWDVHHGNGTQEIFENRQDVMFVSLHRYEQGRFYPAGVTTTAPVTVSVFPTTSHGTLWTHFRLPMVTIKLLSINSWFLFSPCTTQISPWSLAGLTLWMEIQWAECTSHPIYMHI